jgi:hypothetical protein
MADVITPGGLPYEGRDAEPSTAAVRDGDGSTAVVAHSHVGQQQPHVHTAESLRDHRRPIIGERVYPGGTSPAEPTPGPATWYGSPYEAAASLRGWAAILVGGRELTPEERRVAARDLRGAASVLDGATLTVSTGRLVD